MRTQRLVAAGQILGCVSLQVAECRREAVAAVLEDALVLTRRDLLLYKQVCFQ
jgi:hypothetical protein